MEERERKKNIGSEGETSFGAERERYECDNIDGGKTERERKLEARGEREGERKRRSENEI